MSLNFEKKQLRTFRHFLLTAIKFLRAKIDERSDTLLQTEISQLIPWWKNWSQYSSIYMRWKMFKVDGLEFPMKNRSQKTTEVRENIRRLGKERPTIYELSTSYLHRCIFYQTHRVHYVWKLLYMHLDFSVGKFFRNEKIQTFSSSSIFFIFLILQMTRRLRVLQSKNVGVCYKTYVCHRCLEARSESSNPSIGQTSFKFSEIRQNILLFQ